MEKFYVSLVADLLGYYIEFEAESKAVVRAYLARYYYDDSAHLWKLPWCAVYTAQELAGFDKSITPLGIIKSRSGPLYNSDYSEE